MSQRPISLAGLRAFEAAAQRLSLTKAADEMHLSQSAISRQVQGLEEELGFAVFARSAREIALTPAGRTFLSTVVRTLAELDRAVELGRRSAAAPRVTITTFASFASMWLIPRLSDLRLAAPDVEIEIGATDRIVDLEADGIDIAVRYLASERAPPGAILLFEEVLFPLASREYLARSKKIRTVADLQSHALIEAVGTGPGEARNSWQAFFEVHGVPVKTIRPALRLDFIAQGFQAAGRGQGVAVAHTYGADQYMQDPELVRALPIAFRPGAGTYLVVSPHSAQRAEVVTFVNWIRAEANRFNVDLKEWLNNAGSGAQKLRRR